MTIRATTHNEEEFAAKSVDVSDCVNANSLEDPLSDSSAGATKVSSGSAKTRGRSHPTPGILRMGRLPANSLQASGVGSMTHCPFGLFLSCESER